jgi:hypothetical protein
VQRCIDAFEKGKVAPMTAWKEVRQILENAGIANTVHVHTNLVIVHPCNRKRLLINPHNMHSNGLKITNVGCDEDELNKAVVMELNPIPSRRDVQIEPFRRLVASSKGLLAPLNGAESMASLGSGHTIQFFRATNAGCVTPLEKLQDTHGNLDPVQLSIGDPTLKRCLEQGWDMLKLPWQAEVCWPGLPPMVPKSSNEVINAVRPLKKDHQIKCIPHAIVEKCTGICHVLTAPCICIYIYIVPWYLQHDVRLCTSQCFVYRITTLFCFTPT